MAAKKAKPQNRINKQREIEQKKRKRRKNILITLIIMIVLVGIGVYLFISPTFKIKTIVVNGNSQISKDKILELADIKTGDNIFLK